MKRPAVSSDHRGPSQESKLDLDQFACDVRIERIRLEPESSGGASPIFTFCVAARQARSNHSQRGGDQAI